MPLQKVHEERKCIQHVSQASLNVFWCITLNVNKTWLVYKEKTEGTFNATYPRINL